MDTRSKLEWLARCGYAARGIVFLLIAGLALLSSFGGGAPDSKSALQVVLSQPLGKVWLGLIAVGLLGFVFWRLAQSLANADNHKHSAKGYVIRAALFASGLTYLGLAAYAASHSLGLGVGEGSGGASWTAWLMAQPFGRYLVGVAGLVIVIGGGVTIFKGLTRRFRRYLRLDGNIKSAATMVSVYGLAARGLIFIIIGGFLVYAAFAVDPGQAGSMRDALAWIHKLPFGAVLYTLVALGLAAFGIYNLIEARCRIVHAPSLEQAKQALPI